MNIGKYRVGARALAMSVALGLSGLAVAPASAKSLVINGGFETGVPGNTPGRLGNQFGNLGQPGSGNWDSWMNIDGWRTTSGTGIEIQTNPTLPTIDAQEGSHYVELDSWSNSGMAQTLNLGVGRYLLSFWYSPRTPDPKTNGIEYALGTIGGGKVTNGNPAAAQVGSWVQITQQFIVKKAGAYDLSFNATGTSDSYGGLLDNVSVAPVPLPAAGLGLLAGLGALGMVRRRRKAA